MVEKRFGEYTEEVEEVLEFIRSDRLLSGGDIPDDVDVYVIRSLKQIPTEDDYFYDNLEYTWNDIIANEAAVFYGIESETCGRSYSYDHKFLSELVDSLMERYNKTFPEYYKKYYLDKEIPGILCYIVHCRIIMGKQNQFFEMLFKVFQSGGYPCGWKGKYPEGKLIVFYPKKDKIKKLNDKLKVESAKRNE